MYSFEELCGLYSINGCAGCPYENCESKESCLKSYEEDKNTNMTRLDLVVELANLHNKLDAIIKEIRK